VDGISALPAEPAARFVNWVPLLREALTREGRFRWRLHGTSMVPTLPPECEIEIVPLPRAVPLGSLVVFADGDALVAHRLVCRTGEHWITQGDSRLAPDRPLEPEQILGVVVAAYRDGRRCWPGPFSPLLVPFWVARCHLLRGARAAWRRVRKVLKRVYSLTQQPPDLVK
jgi:hypothetical protein